MHGAPRSDVLLPDVMAVGRRRYCQGLEVLVLMAKTGVRRGLRDRESAERLRGFFKVDDP